MIRIILGTVMALGLILDSQANKKFQDYQFVGSDDSRYVTYDTGTPKPTFTDNTVEWYYNDLNQDLSIFSEAEIIDTFRNAMQAWADASDVEFIYKGKTTQNINNTNDNIITVGYWSESAFIETFGLYAGYTYMFWNGNKVIYEGFIMINAGDNGTVYTPENTSQLQGLITHEVGHLLGIDHSDVSESIMYANPYHSYEYQKTLRDDDIAVATLLYPLTNNSGTTVTIDTNFDISIPSAILQSADGDLPIWAELEYKGVDSNGNPLWGLKSYGENE